MGAAANSAESRPTSSDAGRPKKVSEYGLHQRMIPARSVTMMDDCISRRSGESRRAHRGTSDPAVSIGPYSSPGPQRGRSKLYRGPSPLSFVPALDRGRYLRGAASVGPDEGRGDRSCRIIYGANA